MTKKPVQAPTYEQLADIEWLRDMPEQDLRRYVLSLPVFVEAGAHAKLSTSVLRAVAISVTLCDINYHE